MFRVKNFETFCLEDDGCTFQARKAPTTLQFSSVAEPIDNNTTLAGLMVDAALNTDKNKPAERTVLGLLVDSVFALRHS